MAEREQLDPARGQITLATEYGSGKANGYTVSYGLFRDARPAELFISTNKASSDAEAIARDAAIMISIALQFGAQLEDMRSAATRDGDGRPSSIIGHALDLVAQDLAGHK